MFASRICAEVAETSRFYRGVTLLSGALVGQSPAHRIKKRREQQEDKLK